MNGKEANETFEKAGKTIDAVNVVADVTSFVCSIASLGNVEKYRVKNGNANINTRYNGDKWHKGYSFTYKNITRITRRDMGLTSPRVDLMPTIHSILTKVSL